MGDEVVDSHQGRELVSHRTTTSSRNPRRHGVHHWLRLRSQWHRLRHRLWWWRRHGGLDALRPMTQSLLAKLPGVEGGGKLTGGELCECDEREAEVQDS